MVILRIFLLLVLITFAHSVPIQTTSSDGDIVNCVDKMTQPAFRHDLLKNHKFQESPSKIPKTLETTKKNKWETWEAHVGTAKCPEGTIPIRDDGESVNHPANTTIPPVHEYAIITTQNEPKLYGAKGTINVWDPAIEKGTEEMSISQIWITSGDYKTNDVNTIEVGWQILPQLYRDNKPQLFIFWTSDTYKNGCYNLQCSGFIQTSSTIVIGGAISPVSSFGGRQFEITILVWKDQIHGNWWLSLGPNSLLVGYWPAELFTGLTDHANIVEWGGEILNSHTFGRDTTTQMGSSHFSDEGFGKASYIRNLEIMDNNNNLQPVQDLARITTNPKCYNIKKTYTDEWRTHVFYRGPGFRPTHSGVAPSILGSAFIYLFVSIIFYHSVVLYI